ncbi:Translation initiation factor IF-2 like [Melia azedarach]|uniref:Translation initiation factor IF-2 like n=1 Tax=Melia azedarach TaxID=155640 RepID=A0ACC1YT74_MELAZ|nr:Translation initiation factor IF-2 like [Melia azedarach]
METTARSQFRDIWRKMGNEERKAAVHEEVKRMNKLPPNSTYASHRLRVLNKLLQLMALERTSSQEMELELLFAGLSL